MDAEALKIILDLHSAIYERALTDILLAIHYDSANIMSLNYGLGRDTDATIATIFNDLKQLKSTLPSKIQD